MIDATIISRIEQLWLAQSRRITRWGLGKLIARSTRPGSPAYAPVPGRMLYVTASCLPYHISGYTTRTHAVIRALRDAGGDVRVITRPGYPWDREDRRCDASQIDTVVDGIAYRHIRRPLNNWPVLAYAFLAAEPIIERARLDCVAAIHAASNHVNALPALLAARKLGIPFHYEMRGLWELSRISRMPKYEGTQGYWQGLELESLVARSADKLFVISDQLGGYACKSWGIPGDRMELLPNCVDADRIAPADPGRIEPNTLGYAGSFIAYEGLDTLISAVDMLVKRGVDVKLNIAGDGEIRSQLEAQVRELGLGNHIRFYGRVAPQAAREMLDACALICIPRKPFKVCELVPPIKLVEALAMGKPVIVPDLPVFRDELGEQSAGWFFRAGDVADLARVIETALSDRSELAAMGARARQHAVAHRQWRDFVIRALPLGQG
ncbi:MAG: glycosyltransferase [Rhodocyclaceae bacterium]|nr:glycosyltransferase [Rhodocyclaceae bacterium]